MDKMAIVLFCLLASSLVSMNSGTIVPLIVGTFFGGVVAGIVSVLLFEVCLWGVVRLKRRMKEPTATEEKKGIRFVGMSFHFL